MIGDLIVSIVDEETGLRLYLGQRYRIGGGKDPIVGFNLADPKMITAIRRRNGSILDAIESIIDQASLALDLPTIEHAMGLGWEYHKQGGTDHFNDYIERLNCLIANPFADGDSKRQAESELRAIKKAEVYTEAKRRISRRRRSEFQSKRDQLMLALIERDGYECAECGEVESLSIDHIIPLSKGGSDELDNLQLLCQKHNSSKGDKLPTGQK